MLTNNKSHMTITPLATFQSKNNKTLSIYIIHNDRLDLELNKHIQQIIDNTKNVVKNNHTIYYKPTIYTCRYSSYIVPIVVCNETNTVIGYMYSKKTEDFYHITDADVHPDYQNQRIGTQMVKVLADYFLSIGERKAYLSNAGGIGSCLCYLRGFQGWHRLFEDNNILVPDDISDKDLVKLCEENHDTFLLFTI